MILDFIVKILRFIFDTIIVTKNRKRVDLKYKNMHYKIINTDNTFIE